nr:immunoglobulin light chain junction region [Macaca mulatta]MOW61690.1 immunoglobulin light chain junction region [Macaca mulatta]MOW61692.1 immunoglobulin light chain junction region [Macaca mulatta]MOW61693.1 immunoglobulin light chain junction region [Macaca mulatta]MOW61699.1 immunoglobulin light chain junction region [Macaca mulatta]
CQHSYDTPYSF